MKAHGDEEDDHGDVFLDEDDVIQEITVDEEGLISPSLSLYIYMYIQFLSNFDLK